MPPCRTEDAVIALIRSRGETGRKKYGTSMDRADLTPEQWAVHLQEELADALQYAERVRQALDLLGEAHALMRHLRDDRDWLTAREWLEKYHALFPPRQWSSS